MGRLNKWFVVHGHSCDCHLGLSTGSQFVPKLLPTMQWMYSITIVCILHDGKEFGTMGMHIVGKTVTDVGSFMHIDCIMGRNLIEIDMQWTNPELAYSSSINVNYSGRRKHTGNAYRQSNKIIA